ncbi:RND family efflux transporter, MFP subunit [Paraburkholderia steynii]|uniref:RND family efflux transporter, MFP subunit n=1 Tax=Paraburkholderia steynii TaxID=1245441 RepID=A0A7Z7FKN1_9BURK|nr:efflux RND transporter periplasmic adaptor subunit [Paraburkholderia steynii]SDI50067.1 RND family efflux transporter, MFP subunit [Paraburkholderia steynii]
MTRQRLSALPRNYTVTILILLAGCRHDDKAVVQPPRAVQLATAEITDDAKSLLVATIRQEQRADLAFENGGRITSIGVEVGDRVHRGQVLARIEPEPASQRLQQAEANLQAATARLREQQAQMRQQQAMFDDGSISSITLTGTKVQLETGMAQLRSAMADRALAQRAVRQQEIRAPYDGNVVARLQQPGQDLGPGQAVLRVEGIGHPQAVALVPIGTPMEALSPGKVLRATRSGDPHTTLTLRLRSLSTRTSTGTLVEAIFDIDDRNAALLSGQSLLLTMPSSLHAALTIPLASVLPDERGEGASVFVYDAARGIIRRRQIELGAIDGERIQILAGISRGEQVITAGAAFLSDGEKVLPFRSSSSLADGDTK